MGTGGRRPIGLPYYPDDFQLIQLAGITPNARSIPLFLNDRNYMFLDKATARFQTANGATMTAVLKYVLDGVAMEDSSAVTLTSGTVNMNSTADTVQEWTIDATMNQIPDKALVYVRLSAAILGLDGLSVTARFSSRNN